MMFTLLPSLRGYRLRDLRRDIPAGVIVAALTVPVAMGYAGVAGLPPVYGLYASLLPVLGYVLFTGSRQMVFGMDAAASAMTGTALAALGASGGDAVAAAALLSLFTAGFLLLFAALRLGRFSAYISMPVMSGFMSGMALSIIVGQIPKIMGIKGGGEDFLANIAGMIAQARDVSGVSLLLGTLAAALVILGKRFLPRLPMALIVMVLGTAACAFFRLDQRGVAVVGEIPRGLPTLSLPQFGQALESLRAYLGYGLVIAIVTFADSLMAANSFAQRNQYDLEPNREILAFGVSNACAALSGCPPTSASVSRTAAAEQFHGKSQMVSVVAALIIGLILVFFSSLLYAMPQPVLGGIVLAALVGVVDVPLARRLFRDSRGEAWIFLASAAGVLFVGVLFGVLVGVVLSFVDVILRITAPPRAYLGRIPGREGYYDLARGAARPVPGVVVYRFSARLIFANVRLFAQGVEKALKEKPRAILIDASGINGVDATAADELKELIAKLERAGVAYAFAGQIEAVNRQLREMGLSEIADRHAAKTLDEAMRMCVGDVRQ